MDITTVKPFPGKIKKRNFINFMITILLLRKISLGIFAFCVIFLLVFYIWAVNSVMSEKAAYEVLVSKIEDLASRNQQLGVLLSNAENSAMVLKGDFDTSFEPLSEIVYLRILEGVVARSYEKAPPP